MKASGEPKGGSADRQLMKEFFSGARQSEQYSLDTHQTSS